MSNTLRPSIGTDFERSLNAELLTGRARYVADVRRGDELHARVIRSTHAHARIARVDTTKARADARLVTVITSADIPDVRIPIHTPFADTPEARRFLQPPLARDVVRYVGEPIAVVVAEDPYVAEDVAELVTVDYHELQPVVDVLTATSPDSPPVHAAATRNVITTLPLRHGDVEAAFARADVLVRDTVRMHRHSAVPMETRGLVAEVDAESGRLTIWGGAKIKHLTRQVLAGMLGLDPGAIRIVEAAVGGGFGVRGEPYPEDYLVAFLALRLGRPVKWIEDRAEHFVAANHARDQAYELDVAATREGRLLAFRARVWCDQGAYVRSQGIVPALLPSTHLAGPYRWDAFAVESNAVLTNRTPVGTYRGPGITEATLARERMLDRIAGELELEPVELRRRNLIPAERIPFRFDLGSAPVPPIVYESGDFPSALAALLEQADYKGLRDDRRARRERGESVGLGIAPYTEIGSVGPFEDAFIASTDGGGFTVRVSSGSIGQGVETVLAQIAGDALGVPPQRVTVDHRDTDAVPMGFGTFSSRTTVLAGNAVALAAQDLRAKAAAALDAPVERVELRGGWAHGPGGASVPLAGLGEGHGHFEKPHPSYSFGAALAYVAVERETGRVRVLRHFVMHDIGRAVNPALLRGQLAGAAAQGIGGALFEELAYDESGQPLSTSFADYLMATAAELPLIDVVIIEHPVRSNPLGVKGGGEAGMIGTPAAVANAVADALGPAGAAVTRLPLTPDRVRALLRARGE